MKVVLAKPTRQSDSESADVTTEIMVRVRSVDLDEGQAAVLEPLEADGQHVQIAPPPKKSRKVHYSGISAFQPQQLAPEVVPHFTPLLSIPGLPTDVEIPFDLIKEAINPTSKALEKGTERVRELSEEYAVAVHEARVLALTEDLDDFQISPDPDPTVPPGVKKGPGRPAKFFLDASSLAAVEAKLPFSYEMKAYVAYEIRVRIKNQHGLSPVSRAAVFQRSVPIAVPIPWREPPQHDEHTLAIFQERQARRKAEEEEEERLRAEEEAVAAKALASLALGDGVDSEQEDTVRAKRPKTNPRASIATTVDGETKRKTPHPVEEPDSDPEEEFHKNSSASKSKDGLPDQFPFNLAYGEPIKVQFDKYRDAYECRALWYRKGYLQNAHDTTEKQEGWVLDVHW